MTPPRPGFRKIVDSFGNEIMVPLETTLAGAAPHPFTPAQPSKSTYRRPSPLIGSSPPNLPDESPFPPGQSFPLHSESGSPIQLVMTAPYADATEYPFPICPPSQSNVTPGTLVRSYNGLILCTPPHETTKLRGDIAISPAISVYPLPLAPSPPRQQMSQRDMINAVKKGEARVLPPKQYGAIHERNDLDVRNHQAFCNMLGVVPDDANVDSRLHATPPRAVLPLESPASANGGQAGAKTKKGSRGFRNPNVLFTPADTISPRLRGSVALSPNGPPVSPHTIPFRQPSWGMQSPFTPTQASQGASLLATPNTGPSPGYRFPPLPVVPSPMEMATPNTTAYKIPTNASDLFTPGYTMGPPPGLQPALGPSNSLELDLGEDMQDFLNLPSSSPPEEPRKASPAASPTTSIRPEVLTQLFPEATIHTPPAPAKVSKIASEALANHKLHPDFCKRYNILDEIGSGGFGFVCSAVQTGEDNEAGVEVAVKFMKKDTLSRRSDLYTQGIPTEVWVLRQCFHPNIIGFVDYYEDHKFCYVIQELHGSCWIPGGEIVNQSPISLGSSGIMSPFSGSPLPPRRASEAAPVPERPYLGRRASYDLFEAVEHVRFSENQAKWIFKQIVDGVAYMHRRGFYHRDLKDENVVISHDFTVKIIDFGSAIYEDPAYAPVLHHNFRGTQSYASPEVRADRGYYSGPCDIWSLGIILTILLTGGQPFASRDDGTRGIITLKTVIPNPAFELIKGCLTVDYRSRYTIEDVVQHVWLRNVGPEIIERTMTPRDKKAKMTSTLKKIGGSLKGKKLW